MYAIGGAMALYLGISLSMLFEIIELFLDIMINLFRFWVGKKISYHSSPRTPKGNFGTSF